MRIFISLLSVVIAIVGLANQFTIADTVQINIFNISDRAMEVFGYIITPGMIIASVLYFFGKNNRNLSVIAVVLWGLLAFSGFFMEPVYASWMFLRPVACTVCSILALFVFIPRKQK
ncbi:hypothetical protein MFLO_11210 [Listeria floridensis FSL S10-1187]|uniref:Uncharacterized protein n=1 Tax=Listeria floridensis FSL S10-1187 TaxID=1265817 RepID=A0ABP3AWA3_9LIST|nr:hypothetical protein [Listeria floridensis]EUJ29151.1 hypothetical protein MFLO_11210 [Listeria floridensis FSL S10-1187]